MAKPIVAIVGRPNVGKSTLFNRISRARVAIVEAEPGVTRDRLYLQAEWLDRPFTLVDTGGIDIGEDDMAREVRRQAAIAIAEADVIIFVVDGRAGLTPADEDVAEILRKANKRVIVCVNKIDEFGRLADGIFEFYRLGLGEPIAVSAEHGLNIGDLLDEAVASFPVEADEEASDILKVSVVGRPNVGKSSLINRFLNQERVIVSETAGTTRDAIDTMFIRNGREYLLIDTAGLRRKRSVEPGVERYSVIRTLRAVDRSDVAIVLLDGAEGVAEQDKKIAGYAHESGKAVVLAVNKWDLVHKETNTMRDFERRLRGELKFLHYAPVTFISALTGSRLNELLDLVDYAAEQRSLRIPTGRLNEVIQEAVAVNQPPSDKGVRLKVFYAVQAQVNPPVFLIYVNHRRLMHFAYLRYLENSLRNAFGFVGTPLILSVKERG